VQPRLGIAYQIRTRTVVRGGIGYFADRTAINRDTALGGNAPFMSQTALLNGTIQGLASMQSVVEPFTMTSNSPTNVWPTTWDYNVTAEHEFGRGISLMAGYVGNRGLHLQRKRNINQIAQPGTIYQFPSVNPNALRPYLGAGIIDLSENTGLSRYNAFQSKLSKNSGPLIISASYTYSRSTDNTSSLTDVLPNAYDYKDYWGPSDFNIPQALIFSYIYNIPYKGSNLLTREALGNWVLSGINQFESGKPFSVRENIDYAGVGPGSGSQFWNVVGKPDGCSTAFLPNKGATVYCASAFAPPARGTFATSYARNDYSNPGFWEWNLAVHKEFPLSLGKSSNLECSGRSIQPCKSPELGECGF